MSFRIYAETNDTKLATTSAPMPGDAAGMGRCRDAALRITAGRKNGKRNGAKENFYSI